jgi:alpha-tubulin suppressor-like RCC1 family protein
MMLLECMGIKLHTSFFGRIRLWYNHRYAMGCVATLTILLVTCLVTTSCFTCCRAGQLGLPTNAVSFRITPVVIAGLSNVRTISTGQRHVCAVLMDGTARCWGSNGSGKHATG